MNKFVSILLSLLFCLTAFAAPTAAKSDVLSSNQTIDEVLCQDGINYQTDEPLK